MSLLEPSYAQLSNMAQSSDQMDVMEVSRSPAMQDIDIDLDFEDDHQPAGEDETMEVGYDSEDVQIDYDDEMVDDVVEQPEPVDEEIQDASAEIADDGELGTLEEEIGYLQQTAPQQSSQAPELDVLKDVGDGLQGPFEHPMSNSLADLQDASYTTDAEIDERHAVLQEVVHGDFDAQEGVQQSIQGGPLEPAPGAGGAALHSVNGASEDADGALFGVTNDLSHFDNEPSDEDPIESKAHPAVGGNIDDTRADGLAEDVSRLVGTKEDVDDTRDDVAAPSSMERKTSDNHRSSTNNVAVLETATSAEVHPGGSKASAVTCPVIVNYQGSEMALFAPDEQSDHPDAYLLDDPSLVDANLASLFEAIRSVLGDAVGDDEHLVISFSSLKLSVQEETHDAEQVCLSHVLGPYLHLHHNDGVESPEPMRLALIARRRLFFALGDLQRAANQGKTFNEVLAHQAQEDGHGSDNGSSNGTVEPEARTEAGATSSTGQSSATENGDGSHQGQKELHHDTRATPPADAQVDVEDFNLEFDSPLKPSGSAAAQSHRDSDNSGDRVLPTSVEDVDTSVPRLETKSDAKGPDANRSQRSDHAPCDEGRKPTNESAKVEESLVDSGAQENDLDGALEQDLGIEVPVVTNQGSFHPDESNVNIAEQTQQDATFEADDTAIPDEMPHSTFEDDFLFHEDEEATALLNEPLQTVSNDSHLAINAEPAAKIPADEDEADFDASSLLDDAAFDDATAKEPRVEQLPTPNMGGADELKTATETSVTRESRKRSRSPTDEADGIVDLAQTKKRRPS